MTIKKTSIYLFFALIILIASLGFFIFRFISYRNILGAWGNEVYGNGFWLHPLNESLQSAFKKEIYNGALKLFTTNESTYTFDLLQPGVGANPATPYSITISPNEYIQGKTKIYIFSGTQLQSDNLNFSEFIDYLVQKRAAPDYKEPSLEISIIEDLRSGERSVEYLFLSI